MRRVTGGGDLQEWGSCAFQVSWLPDFCEHVYNTF